MDTTILANEAFEITRAANIQQLQVIYTNIRGAAMSGKTNINLENLTRFMLEDLMSKGYRVIPNDECNCWHIYWQKPKPPQA